ncbi:Glutamate 5-kinase [Fusarium duplospermum]|uniref:Glutamate 5-kinase n=1 Tax=Fusarium duplospermum TaxID=1325734 RepID=A0A428PEZ6_9HYPO|nr:Glutamate 5-kinase [Fusarium duplospermum]
MTSEITAQSMRGNGKSLTIVIKLGTSSIVDEKTHEPLLPILTLIVDTAVKLRKDGHRVVIVSSGAIGVGLRRMDVEKRPKHLAQLQVGSQLHNV